MTATTRKPYGSTEVPAERTKEQIKDLLTKWGARKVGLAEDHEILRGVVKFEIHDRHLDQWLTVRVEFELPNPNAREFQYFDTGNRKGRRSPTAATDLWKREERRRWRCCWASIKQSLVNIDTPIRSALHEFYSDVVIPGTRNTVREATAVSLHAAIAEGATWPALGGGT